MLTGTWWLVVLHLAATGVMIGIIWFVQVVHYPLMALVGRDGYPAYQAAHARRTTGVVMPPMLLEMATGAWLALRPSPFFPAPAAWTGLALLVIVWASTFFLQVPQHSRLEGGFDDAAHRRLVRGNWIRTVAWTLRGILLLANLPALSWRPAEGGFWPCTAPAGCVNSGNDCTSVTCTQGKLLNAADPYTTSCLATFSGCVPQPRM